MNGNGGGGLGVLVESGKWKFIKRKIGIKRVAIPGETHLALLIGVSKVTYL